MTQDQKYSCTNEFGAEFLVFITSLTITIPPLLNLILALINCLFFILSINLHINFKRPDTTLIRSMAYDLLLPLMSYLFSQAKQYYPEGRAQLILIWMVFIEIIRIRGDPVNAWRLRKSAVQLVRLFWISFLIYSYTSLNGIRVSLFILCVYYTFYEVLKGIFFYLANHSYLIGNNPNLIYNYVKRILLKDNLRTMPLDNCGFIVCGEQNHETYLWGNGYILGKKKTDSSKGVLTIGRVFQLNLPEDEALTSKHPHWRDTCLSFALAKILRCRFANISLDELNCKKALDFVLEGLIDYIGSNGDERNPIERVFRIIQDQLNIVSDFLQMEIPIMYYFPIYTWNFYISNCITIGGGIYLLFSKVVGRSYAAQNVNGSCFLQTQPLSKMNIFAKLDEITTGYLLSACLYIIFLGRGRTSSLMRWIELQTVSKYIYDPAKYTSSSSETSRLRRLSIMVQGKKNDKESQVQPTVLDTRREKIICCIKVTWPTILSLPKWLRRIIPRESSAVQPSTNAKKAILMSLKNSGGRLTNGVTSINNHGMEHLNWACRLHDNTTEVILVWHIATTLFHHADLNRTPNPTNQEEQEVALELSCYCHYLVAYRPELLPDKAEWIKDMYEDVRKDISDIDKFFDEEPTKDFHCNYALQAKWKKNSAIEKGANLAKDLIKCADGTQVWKMLADFWAEMMLFIAPSDNVEAHQEMLTRGELITQLWALLTHAGILSRPKPTEYHLGESDESDESSEIVGDANV